MRRGDAIRSERVGVGSLVEHRYRRVEGELCRVDWVCFGVRGVEAREYWNVREGSCFASTNYKHRVLQRGGCGCGHGFGCVGDGRRKRKGSYGSACWVS